MTPKMTGLMFVPMMRDIQKNKNKATPTLLFPAYGHCTPPPPLPPPPNTMTTSNKTEKHPTVLDQLTRKCMLLIERDRQETTYIHGG